MFSGYGFSLWCNNTCKSISLAVIASHISHVNFGLEFCHPSLCSFVSVQHWWPDDLWYYYIYAAYVSTELISGNFLIVADSMRRNLFQVGLATGEMAPILPVKIRRPIAVAYDEQNSVVYWTDVAQRSIGRYSLQDRLPTIQSIFFSTEGKDTWVPETCNLTTFCFLLGSCRSQETDCCHKGDVT